jgi:autotransporter-associated beta strand protein
MAKGLERAEARFFITVKVIKTIGLIGITLGVGVLAMPGPAAAAVCTWTGAGGDTRWNTTTNWSGCPRPANGDSVVFPAGAPALSVNDIAGLTLHRISIDGLGGGGISYVITGAGVAITAFLISNSPADANGNSPTLDIPLLMTGNDVFVLVPGTAALEITGTILQGPAFTLTKEDSGLLILASPFNAWAHLNINGGIVRIGAAGAVPATALIEMSSSDAFLDLNDFDTTLDGLQGLVGPPIGSGTLRLGRATLTINGFSAYSGQITGTGNLVINGSSVLSLFGPRTNTYTGTTTVNGGTLRLAKGTPGLLAVRGPLVVNGGTLRMGQHEQIAGTAAVILNSPGVFDLDNYNQSIGSLAGDGAVTLDSAQLVVGGNNASATFSGTISGFYDVGTESAW